MRFVGSGPNASLSQARFRGLVVNASGCVSVVFVICFCFLVLVFFCFVVFVLFLVLV